MARIREGSLDGGEFPQDPPEEQRTAKKRRKSGVKKPKSKKNPKGQQEEEKDSQGSPGESQGEKPEFVAPEPRPLETLFERSRSKGTASARSGSTRAGRGEASQARPDVDTDVEEEEVLMLGKSRALRVLDPPPYWVEDEGKAKHRQRMTRKAFKGNRRMKLVPLSDDQEDKLIKLIESKDEEEEEESAEDQAVMKANGKENQPAAAKSPLPTLQANPPPMPTPIGGSAKGKNRRRSQALLPPPGTPAAASQTPRRGKPPPADPSLSSWMDATANAPEATAKISKEEFFRQISEADSLFGVVAGSENEEEEDKNESSLPPERRFKMKKTVAKKKPGRESISVKVRRSSRLLHNSDDVGTVYQMTEIDVKASRKRPQELMEQS